VFELAFAVQIPTDKNHSSMKTSLKALSLLLAVSFPTALFAHFAGAAIPATLDVGHVFAAFVTSLTLLIVFSDYSRASRLSIRRIRGRVLRDNVIPLHSDLSHERQAA
jgi:hypothetical protein